MYFFVKFCSVDKYLINFHLLFLYVSVKKGLILNSAKGALTDVMLTTEKLTIPRRSFLFS